MRTDCGRRRLSLHQLCALEANPVELVGIAAGLGCDHVCIFTHVPEGLKGMFPGAEDPDSISALAEICLQTGVSVHNIEYFPIGEATDPETFRGGFERGMRLGAKRATVHVNDPQLGRALDTFRATCAIASEYKLSIGLEFTYFSQIRSIIQAAQFVGISECPNADVVVDALHLFRSGGTPNLISTIAPGLIGYAQICDGPREISAEMRVAEAVSERLVPGSGDFPLEDFVARIPRDVVLDIEVPLKSLLQQGVGPAERASLSVTATRELLKFSQSHRS